MTAKRMNRLLNRHCLLTFIFFVFLLLIMYHIGEARTYKSLAEKVVESIMAATVDLFVSLARTAE